MTRFLTIYQNFLHNLFPEFVDQRFINDLLRTNTVSP